jgi:hypothetical protein
LVALGRPQKGTKFTNCRCEFCAFLWLIQSPEE